MSTEESQEEEHANLFFEVDVSAHCQSSYLLTERNIAFI